MGGKFGNFAQRNYIETFVTKKYNKDYLQIIYEKNRKWNLIMQWFKEGKMENNTDWYRIKFHIFIRLTYCYFNFIK